MRKDVRPNTTPRFAEVILFSFASDLILRSAGSSAGKAQPNEVLTHRFKCRKSSRAVWK